MIPASCTHKDKWTDAMLIVFKVVCTGKEERLLDCYFPEDFGLDDGSDYYYTPTYDYNADSPAPSDAAPESAPMENDPVQSGGLPSFYCDRDTRRFSVICRQFEITGARFRTMNADLLYLGTVAVYYNSVSIHALRSGICDPTQRT